MSRGGENITKMDHMDIQEEERGELPEREALVKAGRVEREEMVDMEGVVEGEVVADRQEREVVFGRVPLDKLGLAYHWAVKVGQTWYEVGAGPDSTDGHIDARLESVGPTKINIIGQYGIVQSEGDNAVSGASPSSPIFSPTSVLWSLVSAGVGFVTFFGLGFLITSHHHMTLKDSLWLLFFVTFYTLFFACMMGPVIRYFDIFMRSVALFFILAITCGPVMMMAAVEFSDNPQEQKEVSIFQLALPYCLGVLLALDSGQPLGKAVGRCLGLEKAGVLHCGVLGLLVTAFVGGGLGPLLKLIIFTNDNQSVMAVIWVLMVVLLIRMIWGAMASLVKMGRNFSVLGTTRRTNTEIANFNQEFKRRNPKYLGLTVNCQYYVVALVDFTLAKDHGQRFLELPTPESVGTILTGANGRNYDTIDV